SEGADVADAIARAHPDVVVFDIALPYEANWELCASLRKDPRVGVPFVLTTTNRAAVERLTSAREVVEILGKPYDLDQFAQAVRACGAAAGPRRGRAGAGPGRRGRAGGRWATRRAPPRRPPPRPLKLALLSLPELVAGDRRLAAGEIDLEHLLALRVRAVLVL